MEGHKVTRLQRRNTAGEISKGRTTCIRRGKTRLYVISRPHQRIGEERQWIHIFGDHFSHLSRCIGEVLDETHIRQVRATGVVDGVLKHQLDRVFDRHTVELSRLSHCHQFLVEPHTGNRRWVFRIFWVVRTVRRVAIIRQRLDWNAVARTVSIRVRITRNPCLVEQWAWNIVLIDVQRLIRVHNHHNSDCEEVI